MRRAVAFAVAAVAASLEVGLNFYEFFIVKNTINLGRQIMPVAFGGVLQQ